MLVTWLVLCKWQDFNVKIVCRWREVVARPIFGVYIWNVHTWCRGNITLHDSMTPLQTFYPQTNLHFFKKISSQPGTERTCSGGCGELQERGRQCEARTRERPQPMRDLPALAERLATGFSPDTAHYNSPPVWCIYQPPPSQPKGFWPKLAIGEIILLTKPLNDF